MGAAGAAAGIALMPTAAFAAQKVTHQLGWIKSIQFGGHFAAIENGYFRDLGIDAEFVAGGPNGIGSEVAVATGQATTSDTDVDGTVRARISGMPVKAFAAIMQKAPGAIMSLAAKPIHALKDLPGKTIALPDGVRPQVNALLTANGLDPASVKYVPVGTDPGILAAGQVDGYYGWATNQGVMLKTRGVDIAVAYMNDLGVPGYAGVLIATDETIDKKKDLLVAWLKAEIKGWQWQLDHPDEMAELMVNKYGQRGLNLEAQKAESRMMKEFLPIGAAATNGLLWIEPEAFKAGLAFSVSAGLMKDGALSVSDVMTQDLIKLAHAKA
ncbi:MAG: ABC transporter substrate-binding protein [Ancalomicrobiaceae bacterium]|nr:ABC transporter substrate-binding protein [Ancalomicrobiaceae bacterium]